MSTTSSGEPRTSPGAAHEQPHGHPHRVEEERLEDEHYVEDETSAHAVHLDPGRVAATQRSDEFAELRRRLRSFVFPMTAAFLAWFLLLIICANYARGFMAHKLVGRINVAYVFALLQFVSTFLIAWLYARYANRRLDPLADRLRTQVEGDSVR